MSTEDLKVTPANTTIGTSNATNAALVEGAKEVTQKYTEDAWDNAEKKLSEFDTNVLKMLIASGTGEDCNFGEQKLKVMGDNLYKLIRELININDKNRQINLIEKITSSESEDNASGSKKTKTKVINLKKVDQMRLDNAKKTVTSQIKSVTDTFSVNSLTPYSSFRSDILEIRAIGLMYCLWFICHNKIKYSQSGSEGKYYPFVLSIIVATERFLKACSTYIGKDMVTPGKHTEVSATLISDMNYLRLVAKSIYPYDGFTIYNHAPELLIYSEYDKCIPSKGITPRKNQKDVISFSKTNFETGFLLSYKAMISSGKTTCSIALIKYMETLRKHHEKYRQLQFIFCCNLASVKCQVAQICYNTNVPFAMTHVEKDGTAKIINNFNCVSDAVRVCIIGSPDAISLILADHSKGNPKTKYFLFHDEPTIGADVKGSNALKDNVTVMSNLPKWSILSSATMPDIEILEPFTTKFMEDNPNAVMDTVYSDEIQIGCDVMTLGMDPVIPHLGCSSGKELLAIVNTIKKNPFLGRIYTHNVAQTIWTECSNRNIDGIPDIPEIFKDVENLSADNVRRYVMIMLETIASKSNEVVSEICATPIIINGVNKVIIDDKSNSGSGCDSESESESESDDGFAWETEEVIVDKGTIEYDKLGTTQAYRFLHMNLIATTDPLTFTIDNFKDILLMLKNHEEFPVSSAKNILAKYKKEIDIYNNNINRLEKNVDNEDALSKQIDELRSNKPQIKFPQCGQINTIHHINKYSPAALKTINKRFVGQGIVMEDIPYETFSVPDNILLLLFCGIGIYSPGNRMLDQNYINTVLSLAESGQLAYLVADSSICYGTNYPINRVFVVEDFSDNHSIYTLFQLMGRAGRVGRSWKAEAYVHDSCARAIIKYSKNPDEYNTEGDNMVNLFKQLKNEHDVSIMKEITKMQDELTRLEEKAKKEENAKRLAEEKVKESKMKLVRVGDVFTHPVDTNNTRKGGTWKRSLNESPTFENHVNQPINESNKWKRKDKGGELDEENSLKSKYYSTKNSKETSNNSDILSEKPNNQKYVPPHTRDSKDKDKKNNKDEKTKKPADGGSMSWRKR
jgi:hypothetical protein